MSDVQDDIQEYIDESRDSSDEADYAGGGSGYSMPDETPNVAIQTEVSRQVSEAVERERKQLDTLGSVIVKTNPNVSAEVQFRTFALNAAMNAVMIAKEKNMRGDTVITLLSAGPISIGLHPGINPGGSDTVAITGAGASRTIRTRRALWAVTSSIADETFDVQEEFD